MSTKRIANESPVYQGANESIAYEIDFTNWGTPSSPSVEIFLSSALTTDLADTLLTGSASVAGDTVTTPAVHSLTAGTAYVLRCTATVDGNTVSATCRIVCDEV